MPVLIQPSFAHGEVAPALYGRVDTTMYQSALRLGRNIVIRSFGGASNRPGLSFVGPVRDHSYDPRLIKFSFDAEDHAMLEFGDEYVRVIVDDAHVTNTPVAITAITKANPCQVTSASHGMSTGDEVFFAGVVGMTRLNNNRYLVTVIDSDNYTLNDQVTNAAVDTTGSSWGAYVSGGTGASIFTAVSPYAIADVATLKYTQSADVMSLTHPSYPPYELQRTGTNTWTFVAPSFEPSIASPTTMAVAVGTTGAVTRLYTVTASKETTLEESLPGLDTAGAVTITGITAANPAVVTSASHGLLSGDVVQIDAVVGMTELNGQRFTLGATTTDTFALLGVDSTLYTAYSSAGTATPQFVRITNGAVTANDTLTWDAVAGAIKYSVYCNNAGVFGWLGDTAALTYTNTNQAPDASTTPPNASNPFLGIGNYPGATGFYQQRQVYGATKNAPDTSVYSRTGSYDNLSASTPANDSDAITATLASTEVNEIRHYLQGTSDCLIFTAGAEWQVNSGTAGFFGPSSIQQWPQSTWGSSDLAAPIMLGRVILYITENRASVRTMTFSWQVQGQGYIGTDATILSNHLLETYQAQGWCLAKYPDPIFHIIRDDGQVVCCTYNEEQQMIAWARWDTQGSFTMTAALPHNATEIDEAVYFVVKRQINGNTVRFIERTHSRRFVDPRDCFFVDAGVSYDNPLPITGISLGANTTITSASHGLTTGQYVDISDILWQTTLDELGNAIVPNQLNTYIGWDQNGPVPKPEGVLRCLVGPTTTDTFVVLDQKTEAPIVSTGWNAYLSGGNARLPINTVTALDYLENTEVVVLADGNVIEGLTVTNGQVNIGRLASRIHVGLQYISDMETLDIEAPSGTIQGLFKKVSKVVVRFEKSRGLLIGHSEVPEESTIQNDLIEMKQRSTELMGDPTALLTGDKEIILDPSWNTNGRIFMRQKYPLPMTILAVIPTLSVGG
ncbi:MAG TPA: ubiquitin-activating E1 FCCH domain-containing protein [Rhodanobacter sp.]|nr:ubiquitin-activating E1 FCCH domain-containing protein [Rhodanobacter sp.]